MQATKNNQNIDAKSSDNRAYSMIRKAPYTKNRYIPDTFFALFSHNSVDFMSKKKQSRIGYLTEYVVRFWLRQFV